MQHPDALLLAAVREALRRYRMPPLPADAMAAAAAGPETALAFAIEAARMGRQPLARARDLFLQALAALVGKALAVQGGDPAFQALVLRASSAEVADWLRLADRKPADRRALRAATDFIAHPGKLRGTAAGPLRDGLGRLHALATSEDWVALRPAAQELLAIAIEGHPKLRDALQALLADAALQRLERGRALRLQPDVQQYLALRERHGPAAGSDAAAAHGRASAQVGSDAEQAAWQALHAAAQWLNDCAPPGLHYRAVAGLLTPRGFPGSLDKAKDEWDVAIVRGDTGSDGVDVVLLAEVKASPAAATSDFGRLVRGLQRLALADAGTTYAFASAEGELPVRGASLRLLQTDGQALPPHVIYACAAHETRPQWLGAASRAVLLAEPASVAFAQRMQAGAAPAADDLAAVWDALTTAPRLRATLHQDQTAAAAREAMLHPDDLLAALRRRPGRSVG